MNGFVVKVVKIIIHHSEAKIIIVKKLNTSKQNILTWNQDHDEETLGAIANSSSWIQGEVPSGVRCGESVFFPRALTRSSIGIGIQNFRLGIDIFR